MKILYQVILVPNNPYMDEDRSGLLYETLEEAEKAIKRSGGKTEIINGVKWTAEIREVQRSQKTIYNRDGSIKEIIMY